MERDLAYLTPEEFVCLSGLSLSTVRRYLADGRLPKIQPGGRRCRVLIPCDALGSYRNQTAVPDNTARTRVQLATEVADSFSTKDSPNCRGPVPRWMRRR